MPRISVIVPVYNSSAFLRRCLDSLAAMSFQDFEVITIDDGSDDDSWSIIEDFARRDPRFSRSLQTPHCGLGPARNRGLEIARGEFVAFVDSDDYVDPEYCGVPYALACERETDLVCFGCWWVYPERRDLHQPTYKEGMSPREALLSMTPMVWDKLYRRDFLQSRHLDFPAIYHEDEVFMPLLMAHAPRIAVLSRPLYYYVRREGSISGLRVNPKSVDVLQAFQLVIDHSLALPAFRHELEFYAVRFLAGTDSSWAACGEDWTVDCRRRTRLLLDAIDHPAWDNPYLTTPSAPIELTARYPAGLITYSIPHSPRQRPKISVIIPCFKQARFLPDALACLQNQTFPDWECIIVNDGSPDHTAEVAREWGRRDSRFRYVEKTHGGTASARNSGIRQARGDFIQFLDADDLIESSKFAWQMEIFANSQDLGIVYGDMRYFPVDSPAQRHFAPFDSDLPWIEDAWLDPRPMLEKLLERNILGINCAMIRGSVITRVGFFEEALNALEDWHYWFRCAASGIPFQFSQAPNTRALVRLHPHRASQNRPAMNQGLFEMTVKIGSLLKEPELRRKNFDLGIQRMVSNENTSRDRQLLRLAWANRGGFIFKPFLRNYLSQHPGLLAVFSGGWGE